MSRYPYKRWLEPHLLPLFQLKHSQGIGTFRYEFHVDGDKFERIVASRQSGGASHGADGRGRSYGVRVVVFNDISREKYSIKVPDGLRFAVNDRPVLAAEYDPVSASPSAAMHERSR